MGSQGWHKSCVLGITTPWLRRNQAPLQPEPQFLPLRKNELYNCLLQATILRPGKNGDKRSRHNTVHLLGPALASVPNYWGDLFRLLLGKRLTSETDLTFLRNEVSKEEQQGAKGWVEGHAFSLQKLQAADEVQCR